MITLAIVISRGLVTQTILFVFTPYDSHNDRHSGFWITCVYKFNATSNLGFSDLNTKTWKQRPENEDAKINTPYFCKTKKGNEESTNKNWQMGGTGFMNWKTCIFLWIRKFAFFFVAQVEIQLISLHSCTSHKYRFIYLRPPLEFIWTCDVWPNGPWSKKHDRWEYKNNRSEKEIECWDESIKTWKKFSIALINISFQYHNK